MNSVDEKVLNEVLKELADLCILFEEALRRFRGRIASIASSLESLQWRTVEAPAPLNPEDRAIVWLKRRLNDVAGRRPEVRVEWIVDEEGRIRGLKYFAPDEEAEGDIIGPAKWAFERAAQKPTAPS